LLLSLFRSMVSPAATFCLCVATAIGPDAVVVADAAPIGQQAGNPADAIVGDWRPSDMADVDVRIFPANGQYLGGIVKAANQDLVNKEMLRGIAFDPSTNTWKGEVFAFKRGEFVPMTIKMTATGFEMVAGAGFMTKTIEWVRVQ
jgi:hypothetical protein